MLQSVGECGLAPGIGKHVAQLVYLSKKLLIPIHQIRRPCQELLGLEPRDALQAFVQTDGTVDDMVRWVNGAGEAAARHCLEHWENQGTEVAIVMPPTVGSDIADFIANKKVY